MYLEKLKIISGVFLIYSFKICKSESFLLKGDNFVEVKREVTFVFRKRICTFTTSSTQSENRRRCNCMGRHISGTSTTNV